MSISMHVRINSHYTRSINLERDSGSEAVLSAYIPTSRAIRTLERLGSCFGDEQSPRAWSLVGPYGSGKSSFSCFLSHLLSSPQEEATKLATSKLKAAAPALAKKVANQSKGTQGVLKVLITGAPQPMARRILEGLGTALSQAWSGRRGKRPPVFKAIDSALQTEQIAVSDVLEIFEQTQETIAKAGFSGILLLIDELGKFLEYEARHYGANDIYLIQSLAERACAGHACNLYLYVMLHQSFEQYAKGLGENLKNEWSKVQGRFEEIPFVEPSEQVLRVVSSAIELDLPKSYRADLRGRLKNIVGALSEAGALPATLTKSEAIKLFESTYPLHPVSALLLPVLCQKLAQNERTLFSYLGSHEDHGMIDMLERLEALNEWILPHHVFDYFVSNQSAVTSDYTTHRRWAEVVTAIERLGDADGADLALLKSIGILNIIGAKGGLKASKEILGTLGQINSALSKSLKKLTRKSTVTFRKFSNEYRVWQGSDFDLEEVLQESLAQIGEFELAETLNREQSLQPVVARRYTIRNGALRCFYPQFVDARTYAKLDAQASKPRLILFLAGGQDDEQIFYQEVIHKYSELDVLALCKSGSQLREATAEVVALRHVGSVSADLNADPIAKREYEDRLSQAEQSQELLVGSILELPQDSVWYHGPRALEVPSKRAFQEQLSSVLEGVYSKAPTLHNELVNRDRPSSSANAARNKLLYAMVQSPESLDLGIDKFPAEKAIYRSLLKETKLHQEVELDRWEFREPGPRTPFFHVWKVIDAFLDETEKAPKSFADLNTTLMAPPYGVKAGVLPILYIAAYCVYQRELALYENKQYRPSLTEELIDRFVRRPDEFSVQRFRIQGLRASIYEQYKTLFTDGEEKTVVQLVRPLAGLIESLPEYTRRTRSGEISESARKVRDAFIASKSPEKLLFEDLPAALGYAQAVEKEGGLGGFASSLMEALRELKYTHNNLLRAQQQLLANAFHMRDELSLEELRNRVVGRYEGLDDYTVDVDGLKAFIRRITKRSSSDEEWLENILTFLGQKPSTKWSDADRAEAEVRLSDFAKRILDLETLRLHYDKSSEKYGSDFDVILLKTMRKGAEPIDEVVAIDSARHEAIKDVKAEIFKTLDSHSDNEIKLAILAELVDEFLAGYRDSSVAETKKKYESNKTKPKGKVRSVK